MKAFNKKKKPKHMVVRAYRLDYYGNYELLYYDRFTKDRYVLVDDGYIRFLRKW